MKFTNCTWIISEISVLKQSKNTWFAANRERTTVYLLCIFNVAYLWIAPLPIFWLLWQYFSLKVQIFAQMLTCTDTLVSHRVFLLHFIENFFSLSWGFLSKNSLPSHASYQIWFLTISWPSAYLNHYFSIKISLFY